MKPQTPTLKSGKSTSYTTNRIYWNSSTKVSGYKIYRRQKTGTKWEYLKTVSSGNTYYDDKKAQLGKSYIYTVKGYWKKGSKVQNSGYKASGYRITTAIKTPSITDVSSSGLNVKIKWSKIAGAQGYRVFRIKKGESKWTKIADLKGNSKFVYTDTTVKQDTQYTYAVRAWRKSGGKIYWSAYEKEGIKTLALGTPSITKVLRNQDMSVKIAWNKIPNADSYYIYRRKKVNEHWDLVAKVKTLSYTDKDAASENYLYTVRAYNGTKRGGYKSGKMTADIPKVVNAKAAYGNNGNTVIHWDPVKGAECYYVYRRIGQGAWTQLEIVEGKRNVTYFDHTAKTGETYQYAVRAFRKLDGILYLGPYEDGKLKLTVQLEEPVMHNLSYNAESNSLTLTWKSCKDAQGYLIYKKTNKKWERIGESLECNFEIDEIQSEDLYAAYTVQAYRTLKDKKIYSTYDTHGLSKKNYLYEDSTILFEGDSIVYGRYDESDKPGIVNYPQRIGELLGCHVENKAVSGSTLGPVISREKNSIYYRLINGKVQYAGYDAIVIGIGTNDFYKNVELGSFQDSVNEDSFYGYLKFIVEQIRQQNPEGKIVFVTPIYRGRMAPTSCDVQGYDMKNKLGYTLRQYCKAMKDVSSLYDNVYVYDSEAYNVINKDNYLYAMYDSLHPTQVYYAKLGNSIAEYLTTVL